jgi:regulatory protein
VPLSLKARALKLLAQREHTRSELRRKLVAHAKAGAPVEPPRRGLASAAPPVDLDAEIDRLLDMLQQQGWLSDERFVASRVQACAPRFGLRRIEDDIARHGAVLDAETGAMLRDSELDRARVLWTRRYGHAPADVAERARQMRFLAGRGFAHDVIRRVVPPAAGGPRESTPEGDSGTD